MLHDGYSLLLPFGLLDYFTILNVEESRIRIKIYQEEKNNLNDSMYESKGFYPNVLVNDFPVRGKSLLFDLRRHRWVDKQTGEYLSRDFNIVAEGTHKTSEFASFLKGLPQ